MVFSAPIASGDGDNETPMGDFRVTAYHSAHRSTEYCIENTDIPYPMTWALRFHVDREGVTHAEKIAQIFIHEGLERI